MRKTTHQYYQAWAAQNRDRVRELLHNNLTFASPQDHFESADAFLSTCWTYSAGLTAVHFVKEVYEADRAFVILRWLNDDGSSFWGAEYLESSGGEITRILVANNEPSLAEMIQ